jgi:hypothetical protein
VGVHGLGGRGGGAPGSGAERVQVRQRVELCALVTSAASHTWCNPRLHAIPTPASGCLLFFFVRRLGDHGIPYGYSPVLLAHPDVLRCAPCQEGGGGGGRPRRGRPCDAPAPCRGLRWVACIPAKQPPLLRTTLPRLPPQRPHPFAECYDNLLWQAALPRKRCRRRLKGRALSHPHKLHHQNTHSGPQLHALSAHLVLLPSLQLPGADGEGLPGRHR